MTPQELKNSILQLAIQGKLVEQRPEEGTAEELFQKIQEEKQRLIAEKKIKKESRWAGFFFCNRKTCRGNGCRSGVSHFALY